MEIISFLLPLGIIALLFAMVRLRFGSTWDDNCEVACCRVCRHYQPDITPLR